MCGAVFASAATEEQNSFRGTGHERSFFMNAKRMTVISMLAAMCAVLGAISIDLGNLKITLESIPVILGAALFGPIDGALVGFVGTFVYQVIRYGFSVTTLLWMLPYCVCGLIVGFYAKKRDYNLSVKQMILIVVIAELVITTLNTGVLYIDSKIYGYYSAVYIFGTLVPRYLICVGKAVAEGALLPLLIKPIKENILKKEA